MVVSTFSDDAHSRCVLTFRPAVLGEQALTNLIQQVQAAQIGG
ncbi:hypothetical protein [Nocardia sp. NPDC050710]